MILAQLALISTAFLQTGSQTDPLPWLRDHVKPIKVSSDDFRDLEPLRKLIGDARVVQLGELTHGDGTAFKLKARLIRFLHEKMGFDVLVWESGLLECEAMNAPIAASGSISDAARLGVFSHWSTSAEAMEVFEYAREQAQGKHPLLMSGFDIQFSGAIGLERFKTFIAKLDSVDTAIVPAGVRTSIDEALTLAAGSRKDAINGPKMYADAQARALGTADALFAAAKANDAKLAAKLGKREAELLLQTIENMVDLNQMMLLVEQNKVSQTGRLFIKSYNIRERSNAKNILWLANSRYKGKKLIVWAHNAHVSHSGGDGTYQTGSDPEQQELDSTGRLVKLQLKDKLYSLGFLAHSGTWNWLGGPPIAYTLPADGSVEAQLHRLGVGTGFLDLRQARLSRSWISQPQQGFINRQSPVARALRWPDVFDGVLYVDRMEPRTQVK